MTLGEYWKEYHTVITLVSGGALTYGLYKLPKPGPVLKVLILAIGLFSLTGLLGLLKYSILAGAIFGQMYGGGYALWIYGVIAKRAYGWDLAWWQIFVITGLWFPASMVLDMGIKALLVTLLKRMVSRDSAVHSENNRVNDDAHG